MHLLFCGDIVGREGRDAVIRHLSRLRAEHPPGAVIVNGDNAAGGFGITAAICDELFQAGADVVTGGDHVWDQREVVGYISHEKRLLRPLNFPPRTPGSGKHLFTTAAGKRVLVVHLLGQVFHKEHLDCPFAAADRALEGHVLGRSVDAILVDFHAEATSEKNALGLYLDGRVSVVVGSHTHIPTNDARILPNGTAYQTDAGMCGVYDSVIGFDREAPLQQFLHKMRKVRMTPAQGTATVAGLRVVTDDKTGLAQEVEAFQIKE